MNHNVYKSVLRPVLPELAWALRKSHPRVMLHSCAVR